MRGQRKRVWKAWWTAELARGKQQELPDICESTDRGQLHPNIGMAVSRCGREADSACSGRCPQGWHRRRRCSCELADHRQKISEIVLLPNKEAVLLHSEPREGERDPRYMNGGRATPCRPQRGKIRQSLAKVAGPRVVHAALRLVQRPKRRWNSRDSPAHYRGGQDGR